ncbi:putative cytokinetic ring protein SteA [Nocardioides sp.]|uniref:putative cytokinetic ring protein SteA n=1 Tax=Nocardioides sp. TaxID=35761 RepID=UPI0031FE4849|nr:hypothetical protein [Nocardioides sp.]
MKLPARQHIDIDLPGLVGTARVERRSRILLPRLRPGDIAVLDHVDLDRATAQALVDAGVSAVVNAAPMISGRFPNLGPELLEEAKVAMVDGIGMSGLAAIGDGSTVRLYEGNVYVDEERVATGREVGRSQIREDMADARQGMATQLESFTHNSAEFLRREQDLLLHGLGVPLPTTRIAGRTAVVVVLGYDYDSELRAIGPFLREQQPVLIAVEQAADALRNAGLRPDIVIVDGGADGADLPSAKTLKAARDVVVRVERGAGSPALELLDRIGIRPLRFESSATCEDAALILADAGDASVIVGVGLHATLEEFLDRQRQGLASTYLTRLKVGPRLVDASAVPHLYSGRVRPHHLMLVMLAGLVALVAAVCVTPVGQDWADQWSAALSDLIDYLRGLF